VLTRAAAGTVRSSPDVWAAVRAIFAFLESREQPGGAAPVPRPVLVSLAQLTQFLNTARPATGHQEDIETMNVRNVNSFVESGKEEPAAARTVSRTVTTIPHTALQDNSVEYDAAAEVVIYDDETVLTNDVKNDYQTEEHLKFKFSFQPPNQEVEKYAPTTTTTSAPSILPKFNFNFQSADVSSSLAPAILSSSLSSSSFSSPFRLAQDPETGLFSSAPVLGSAFPREQSSPPAPPPSVSHSSGFKFFSLPN